MTQLQKEDSPKCLIISLNKEKVKQLRIERQLSFSKLSKMSGINRDALFKMESYSYRVDLFDYVKLISFYDIDFKQLLEVISE